MKKNLLVSLCLGTVFAVAAQANASSCQINSGAYAGISAGLSAQSGKSNFVNSTNGGAGPQIVQNTHNASLSKNSMAAALFAGYGMKFSGFWAAAELFYQLDRLNTKEEMTLSGNNGNTLKSSSTGAYGAAVHLGFVPNNNCIAYAILSVEARRFNVKFSDTADPVNIQAVLKKSYTSIAFAPGVGVRFALSKNISLRTEYKYAMHRSKKLSATGTAAGVTDVVTIKHKPQVHTFNVGVVYSF